MKQIFITIIMSILPFTISANESTIFGSDWRSFGNSVSQSDGPYVSVGIIGGESVILFYIIFRNQDICSNNNSFTKNDVIDVEGQAVKLNVECVEDDIFATTSSREGTNFVINKFKVLNYVTIGEMKWNAKGFTKQYNNISRRVNAL